MLLMFAVQVCVVGQDSQQSSPQVTGLPSEIDVLVLDPAGAVIQNARVDVRSNVGHVTITGYTNLSGHFNLTKVEPGDYEVDILARGFAPDTEAVLIREDIIKKLVVSLKLGSLMSADPYQGFAPEVPTEPSSSYALIPEVPVPQVPQPNVLPKSPHHNRFRQFFSSLGRKLGMSS